MAGKPAGFFNKSNISYPGETMKICILTPRFPFPENGGDVLRINNIARYLKSNGHILILVSYFNDKNSMGILSEQLYDKIYYVKHGKFAAFVFSMLSFLSGNPIQIGYYFSLTYLIKLSNVISREKPDLYIAHLLRMVPYLNILHLQNKSVVEMTDALSKTYSISTAIKGFSLKKIIYRIERKRIARYEKKIVAVYKKCVLVSEADKEYLNNNIQRRGGL
jgi:hypothetical protein